MATLINRTITQLEPILLWENITNPEPNTWYFDRIVNTPDSEEVSDERDFTLAISNFKEEAEAAEGFAAGFTQRVMNELSFFIILNSGKDNQFDEEILQDLRTRLRTALFNNVDLTPEYETPFLFSGGQLEVADSGLYVWEDRYQVDSFYRK